jgi:hypothetical protein
MIPRSAPKWCAPDDYEGDLSDTTHICCGHNCFSCSCFNVAAGEIMCLPYPNKRGQCYCKPTWWFWVPTRQFMAPVVSLLVAVFLILSFFETLFLFLSCAPCRNKYPHACQIQLWDQKEPRQCTFLDCCRGRVRKHLSLGLATGVSRHAPPPPASDKVIIAPVQAQNNTVQVQKAESDVPASTPATTTYSDPEAV